MELPEWTQSQLINRSPPTGQTHSTASTKKTDLAQFMISEIRVKPLAKTLPQLIEAFAGALTGRIIAQSDKCRVARIVSVGNRVIAILCPFDKSIQQIALT